MYQQDPFDVRCAWGANGLTTLAPHVDVLIIVDVLSFTTCVDVAVGNGAVVYPYLGDAVDAFAASVQAEIVWYRPGSGRWWFSPSVLSRVSSGTRLVLPSPNGSRLSTLVGEVPTFAGCLRNAKAVAEAASRVGRRIGVIAAGERWKHDGSLRPALEDWLGAGAIIAALPGDWSPEARAAERAFHAERSNLPAVLRTIGSGVELIEGGRGADVALSAALNVSRAAPRLTEGAYQE